MADFTETSTFKFLSWCRFCQCDSDLMILAQAKYKDQ